MNVEVGAHRDLGAEPDAVRIEDAEADVVVAAADVLAERHHEVAVGERRCRRIQHRERGRGAAGDHRAGAEAAAIVEDDEFRIGVGDAAGEFVVVDDDEPAARERRHLR